MFFDDTTYDLIARGTILTAIGRQERLTPELRERIETATDRRDLEDLYLPYKPKRRSM